jgi:hypothetical protein
MVWDWDGYRGFCRPLLHYNVTATPANFFKTMLFEQAAKILP